MSDKTVASTDIKDAEVVGKADGQPAAKPITFAQQVFIWSMILLVGVIFGVGSSWTLLGQGGRTVDGVSETDLLLRQETGRRLQDLLNPMRSPYAGEMFELRSYEETARQVKLARYAASQGLSPTGEALTAIERDFLATPVPGQAKRTYYDVLAEHRGAKEEVTANALRRFLAERASVHALFAREMIAPAVSSAVAEDVVRLMRQKVTLDEVVLTAEHFLADIKADDPELQATYDRLRSTRFTRPARITATVARADLNALIAAEVVSDGEVAARYETTKETWKVPQADANAPATYKPLADVAGDIKAAIARERAEKKAHSAVDALNQVIDEKGLENADGAAFKAAAEAAHLTVAAVTIAQPDNGQVDLGDLGHVQDSAKLFSQKVGFISSPLQATGDAKTWFVVRIDQLTAAGFQDFAEVKDQVMRTLAGTRAYKELLTRAEALRKAASDKGAGGLTAVLIEPAQAAWKAKATSPSVAATTEYRAPAAELGGAAGDPRLAISLAPSEVVLAEAPGVTGDVPQVRLVQVREVAAVPAVEGEQRSRYVEQYRSALLRYRSQVYQQELKSLLGR